MTVSVQYAAPFGYDRAVASGFYHSVRSCLREQFDHLEILEPLQTRMVFSDRVLDYLARRGLGIPQRLPYHTWANASGMAAAINRRIATAPPSAIVLPTTIPAARISGKVPVVVYIDAPIACMVGYYREARRVSRHALAEALATERAAFDRCCAICVASEWAKRSVVHDYQVEPSKVHVLAQGANHDPELSEEEVGRLARERPLQGVRLLFIGRDWTRKGGPLVLLTLRRLLERDKNATLTIVGCRPAIPAELSSNVSVLGLLSPEEGRARVRMAEAFRTATLLFVPSEAEALGIMYCDALAHGLPVLARRTGGVDTVVKDGVSGRLLPYDATASDYATAIGDMTLSRETYTRYCLGAFGVYREVANWRSIGRSLGAIVHRCCELSEGPVR